MGGIMCTKCKLLYYFLSSHSTEMLVTTAMLQDIYSVKARAPFLRHYGEACAHLTDATFERGIVISTTPVPSLLDLFQWILHSSFCATGNSCSTFVLQHHNFSKVRTVNVNHLNVTVTEKTEGRNRGEGVVVVVVDHMGLAT